MVLYFDASDACVQTSMVMSIFADRYTGVSRNSGPGKKNLLKPEHKIQKLLSLA